MKTNKIVKQTFLVATLLFTANHSNILNAQNIGINGTGVSPAASAGLDVSFSDKGFLAPRVSLTSLNAAGPITLPANSLLVYNINTAGTFPNNVYEGYYYWSAGKWNRISTGESWKTTGNSNITSSNFIGTLNLADVDFRTNGAIRGYISSDGRTAVGTSLYGTTQLSVNAIGGNTTAILGNTTSGDAAIQGQSSHQSGYGLYGVNSSPLISTGIVGIGNGSSTYSTGEYGTGIAGTAAGMGYGVIGSNYNGTNTERYGILGTQRGGIYAQYNSLKFSWMSTEDAAFYGQSGPDLHTSLATQNPVGDQSYAIIASAKGNIYNAGLIVSEGETVITSDSTVGGVLTMPRTWDGSIFTKAENALGSGGRIYFKTGGGYNFYVSSTNLGDYSEYFKTTDQTLGVGEIVALDPEHANGVRRARPSDISNTVGIVSIGGTKYNDNLEGTRHTDPNYVNVGLLGQVPVLITLENGNIKPGDALTVSTEYRGRVTKATGACRIIGYATTNFPYVAGEQTYEIDINGTDMLKLTADHVMCYLNPGWYEPANPSLTDGIEPPAGESAYEMLQRLNVEIPAANPNKETFEKNKVNAKAFGKTSKADLKENQRKEIVVDQEKE